MLTLASLIARLKEERTRFGLEILESSDPDPNNGLLQRGKWQGIGYTLELIEGMVEEERRRKPPNDEDEPDFKD